MRIKFVDIKNFTSHVNTQVAIPDRGLVLVTGDNGAGKSSLLEAVSWSLWGKMLRGSNPYSPTAQCTADVTTDSHFFVRMYRAGRSSFTWNEAVKPATQYETRTKSQTAVEKVIGAHDVWRRTHVFSSADASNFTDASDGDRKRLLETILGLERFDDASVRCRKDLSAIKAELSSVSSDMRVLVARVEESEKRLEEAHEAVRASHIAEVSQGDLEKLLEEEATLEMVLSAITAKRNSLARVGNAEMALAARMVNKIKELADSCPTCGQEVPAKMLLVMHNERERLAKEAKEATDKAISDIKKTEAEATEVSTRLSEVGAKINILRIEIRTAEKLRAVNSRAKITFDSVRRELMALADKLSITTAKEQELLVREATYTAADRVLGLKGVRAHILSKALGGIEDAANSWLNKLVGSSLQLVLSPYTEKKSGGVSDAISLEIAGAGGGHGYKAASGGERRRIDVALMLALAEVSAAAHGTSPGTLFFDEVMDALDDQGQEAVVSILEDLAKDRAVVLITHSNHLKSMVKPVLHLKAENGKYT